MVKTSEQKIYCALDIEATGFDPLTEEILEIGFVFFKLGKTGFETLEEWSQVFRPSKKVSSKILGLTGITEGEIEAAPALSEFHDFLQKKLGEAVLVGHSVGVDVRYLEANGFKLSGKYIDTLELVQFILPTHHSYNLENLTHFFSLSHANAHRALEDARASMLLLEKLIQVFASFPAEVKTSVKKLTEDFDFQWHSLLSENFIGVSQNFQANEVTNTQDSQEISCDLVPSAILSFKLNTPYRQVVLRAAAEQEGQFLFAVANKDQVLELSKKRLATPVFSPEDSFDPIKLQAFLEQKQTNPDLAKFLAKVIVWQGINWQTKTILDLNLSFAGNQFRSLVCGVKTQLPSQDKVLICDLSTLFSLQNEIELSKRSLVIEGLSEFENQLSAKIGRRASWGKVVRYLISIYNPETAFGEVRLAFQIVELLAATDLFFGLTNLTLEKAFPGSQQVTKEDLVQNAKAYRSLEQAAINYANKLKDFSGKENYDVFASFAEALLSFFNQDENRVKWIEFGPRFCLFNNLPLLIDTLAKKTLDIFPKVTFVDTFGEELVGYYKVRLGLQNFSLLKIKQGKDMTEAEIFFSKTPLDPEKVITNLANDLPMALVLPAYKNIKDFYDVNFRRLQETAVVLAEGYSGGTNKMFYNFSLSLRGLLIVTGKLSSRSPRQGIYAKTLVLSALPVDTAPGVYAKALEKHMQQEQMPNASNLNTLENVHKILRLFYTQGLNAVYFYEHKAASEEGLLVEKYINELGFVKNSHI